MLFKALLFFAFFLPISTHANGSLIINEIMYDAEGSDTKHEWIELKNISSSPIDIKDWRINDGANHQIKNDTNPGYFSILPNEYIVLASDIMTFLNEHSGYRGKVFDTVLNLKNTSGHITLLDDKQTIVDDITYQASSGGNGNGKTIERSSDVAITFHESPLLGGTPGKENSQGTSSQNPLPSPMPIIPPAIFTTSTLLSLPSISTTTPSPSPPSGIIISEFLPNPSKGKEEWIELYNTNNTSTTLTGWRLKDNSSGNHIFKDIVLAPNTFFTIFQHDSKIHINNNGDELSLVNQEGGLISKIMFQGKAPQNRSFARRGENDWAWTTKLTPGETNIIVSPPPPTNRTTQELAYLDATPQDTKTSQQSFFPTNISTPLLSILIGLMFTMITIIFIKKFL